MLLTTVFLRVGTFKNIRVHIFMNLEALHYILLTVFCWYPTRFEYSTPLLWTWDLPCTHSWTLMSLYALLQVVRLSGISLCNSRYISSLLESLKIVTMPWLSNWESFTNWSGFVKEAVKVGATDFSHISKESQALECCRLHSLSQFPKDFQPLPPCLMN